MKGTTDSHLIQEQHQALAKRELPYALNKTNKTDYINTFPFGLSGIEEKLVSFSSSRLSPQVIKETVIKVKLGPLIFREAGL